MNPGSPNWREIVSYSITMISLLFLVGVVSFATIYGAPVIPNEGLVTAEVLEVGTVQSSVLNVNPPQVLYRMKLILLSVQDVPPRANFLKDKSGEIVEVYSKEVLPSDLVGKVIKGRITFRGDERSGLYWILEVIEERRL